MGQLSKLPKETASERWRHDLSQSWRALTQFPLLSHHTVFLSNSVFPVTIHPWLSLLGIPSFSVNFILVCNLTQLMLFFSLLSSIFVWILNYTWSHSREGLVREPRRQKGRGHGLLMSGDKVQSPGIGPHKNPLLPFFLSQISSHRILAEPNQNVVGLLMLKSVTISLYTS